MENNQEPKKSKLNRYKVAIIIFLIVVASAYLTKEITESRTEKRVLENIYNGYQQCVGYCLDKSKKGALVQITTDGKADCLCYDIITDNDREIPNQLQA